MQNAAPDAIRAKQTGQIEESFRSSTVTDVSQNEQVVAPALRGAPHPAQRTGFGECGR